MQQDGAAYQNLFDEFEQLKKECSKENIEDIVNRNLEKYLADKDKDYLKKINDCLIQIHDDLSAQHKAHHRLNKYTLFLGIVTLLLFLATGAAVWVERSDVKDEMKENADVKRRDWTNSLWSNYNDLLRKDSLIDQWYNNDLAADIPRARYKQSFKNVLDYFEDLNAIYDKDLVDSDLLENLFSSSVENIMSKKYVHDYISQKRTEMLSTKPDSEAALIFDAIYIWAKRWNINNPFDTVNKKWERWYYKDAEPGEWRFRNL